MNIDIETNNRSIISWASALLICVYSIDIVVCRSFAESVHSMIL
jgi:hypothetical protein